ncbi:MAG: hypothetical protein ABFD60_10640 [Bryobacteraceae bacterium]
MNQPAARRIAKDRGTPDSGAAPHTAKAADATASHRADQRPPEPDIAQMAKVALELGLTVREFKDRFCVES